MVARQAAPFSSVSRGISGLIKLRGGPERSRTSDLRFRKPLLYPAELRDRMARFIISGGFFVALIAVAGIAPSAAQGETTPSSACAREIIGDVTVTSVVDGRTFLTSDGREVHLAGIEAPGTKAALTSLIAGKTVTLKRLGAGEDRYGRIVAYAYLQDVSVQQQLLRAGVAYASARVGPKPCADELFAAETAARQASLGLWADPELRPKSAANRDEILRAKGRFALVEGKVLSVRESGATIYLNFGRRYTTDFSIMIPRRNARQFTAAGIVPRQLQDKRIRVRGVVEGRNGPVIEASRPEQIELIQ
jgi:endonuclease YncB( thermonuclease family)